MTHNHKARNSARSIMASLVSVFMLSSMLVLPNRAEAQKKAVKGEVLIVLAKEAAGEVDEELADLPALRRPPFNSFRTMKLLKKPQVKLKQGKDVDVKLPNGRTLRINLQRVMPDGRYRVKVSINRPNKTDYLPLLSVVASPGDPFFVAGQAHDGGTLVLGVRIGKAKK